MSGKRKRERLKKTWKKLVEEAREDWFEERGCPESCKVEWQSASNCRRNEVNPAISAKGKTPDKN